MDKDSDVFAHLLQRAREGDAESWTKLIEQFEPEVRIVARMRLGPALRPYLDSTDLVQSVHHSLWRGIRHQKFDITNPQQLIALAVTMVRHKAARHWQKLRRQQRESGLGQPGDVAQTLFNLSDAEADPARLAAYQDTIASLCRTLDETDRQLLLLHLEGWSTAEIADQLGKNADVMRVRLSRLRQRIRDAGVLLA